MNEKKVQLSLLEYSTRFEVKHTSYTYNTVLFIRNIIVKTMKKIKFYDLEQFETKRHVIQHLTPIVLNFLGPFFPQYLT